MAGSGELSRVEREKELGQVSAEMAHFTTATPFPRNDTAFMAPRLTEPHSCWTNRLLAQIKSQFTTNSDRPLIVIQGMGGVGKTTHGNSKHELHQHFSDGVLWSDLRLSVADGDIGKLGTDIWHRMQQDYLT